MHQNAIYFWIFWYSKICWYLVKKCWCQQNSRSVSRDSYIFWIFFRWGITVPSFIIVTDFRGGSFLPPPHPSAVPKMPILNRLITYFWTRCNPNEFMTPYPFSLPPKNEFEHKIFTLFTYLHKILTKILQKYLRRSSFLVIWQVYLLQTY